MNPPDHLPEPALDPGVRVRSRSALFATLRRIDGWGPLAWKEMYAAWRIRGGALTVEPREREVDPDADHVALTLILDHGLGATEPIATADWVLRQAWAQLLAKAPVALTAVRPTAAVRATNACRCAEGRITLRLVAELPYAGMCLDGRRFAKLVRQCEMFAAQFARPTPALVAHRRAVAIQQALRAALPRYHLCAFLGAGGVLPRAADGGPAEQADPLVVPAGLRCTIDLGRLGRVTGLGIRHGVTAVAGAPYHGKSTLLAAIQAGIDDHPPGDGRELVVADASAVLVQAEEGRRIHAQDLSGLFAALPGADARSFTTDRASGATSMAASTLQAVAAGCRLLLIDEDTAASNVLAIDAGMRQLLGRRVAGTTTLLEILPSLAGQGISTLLVAGATVTSLGAADRVILMDHFQPRDVTRAARRIAPRLRQVALAIPPRHLIGGERWLGGRHFLAVDVREPERPVLRLADGTRQALDLRRAGWHLDGPLVIGAIRAAAWCWRLAEGGCAIRALGARYEQLIAERGPAAVDPFHTDGYALPPWQLVVTVLERLPAPHPSLHHDTAILNSAAGLHSQRHAP